MKSIVDIKGGLGNQMFCYAFAYSVAKTRGSELCMDTSILDIDGVKDRQLELLKYNIKYDRRISYKYHKSALFRKTGINRLQKKIAIGFDTKVYKEKETRVYDDGVFSPSGNIYYDGFWQNYRYFDQNKTELTKCFSPAIDKSREIQLYEERIEKDNSVSLHVRRGDYVGLNWQLSMEYYDIAIERLTDIIKADKDHPLMIYVFSDDMEYAEDYFSGRECESIHFSYVSYDDANRNIFDMYLMSCCKYSIIANSSYSWWGAYLNSNPEKKVICPVIDVWKEDFYPEDWIKLRV